MIKTQNSLAILLPTDVFPPKCGGAGWSAHALASALIAHGHWVEALVPRRAKGGLERQAILGVPTLIDHYWAPNIPFLLNYFRHERLWPQLANDLVTMATQAKLDQKQSIIHAQHVQVAPAAVMAAARLQIPVVVTVRDHWPWDYFATGLHAGKIPFQEQTWATLATDLPARLGPLPGILAYTAIPYMRAHLKRRQAALRQADAVIANSHYMAQRLAKIVNPERIHVIPNMVDLVQVAEILTTAPVTPAAAQPYLLFVGKLEQNKGAQLLPTVLKTIRQVIAPDRLPTLIIAGDGPLREGIAQECAAAGMHVHFLEWADHNEVLRLMANCSCLLYPSAWGEPLTRVLLEAAACGAPAVAMPTGGTPDIIEHGRNGLLAATAEQLGQQAAEILQQPVLRTKLKSGAEQVAAERFGVPAVVGQIERLYKQLMMDNQQRLHKP